MFKVLFVGEQVNIKKSNIPFDNRYNSGKFLCDSLVYAFHGKLLIAGRPIYKFYFNNAIIRGRVNIELKNKSKGKTVIALGNVADKILTDLRIRHRKIPHPAFFKRFRSNEGYKGYGYLIYQTIMEVRPSTKEQLKRFREDKLNQRRAVEYGR